MAYSDPPTKTTANTITNADLNTYLRDDLDFVAEPPVATLRRTAGIATYELPDSTFQAINFDEGVDTGMHNPVTNNTRIQPTEAGIYLVTGSLALAANPTGVRQALLRTNGSAYRTQRSAAAAGAYYDSVSHVFDLMYLNGSTDYVELIGWQNSGSTLHIRNSGHYPNTWLSATRVARATNVSPAFNLPSLNPGIALSGTDVWNYGVRNNMQRLSCRPLVRAHLTGLQSIANATWQKVLWSTAGIYTTPTGTMWNAISSSRIVFPFDGVYLLWANIVWSNNANGMRGVSFRINGADLGIYAQEDPASGSVHGMHLAWPVSATAGQYAECWVWQDCGAALNVYSDSSRRSGMGAMFLGDLWGRW